VVDDVSRPLRALRRDLPQNFDTAVGGQFWRRELETLGDDFARLSGVAIDDGSLRASIAVYNENRHVIRDLYRARSERPWIFPMSEIYYILRAGNVLPPEEHTAMIHEYLALAPGESDRREASTSPRRRRTGTAKTSALTSSATSAC